MTDANAPSRLAPRYAIYCAPAANSPWWTHWSAWLGRCAVTGQALAQPAIEGLHAHDFHALTAAPRRYGWHATLKAPMRLASGVDAGQLMDAVAALRMQHRAFVLPALQVRRLDDFLALTLAQPCAALERIAAACVMQLDALRAPPSDDELAKRRAAGLSAQQEAHLLRWGYPHVLDTFRFHFSLTGSLAGVAAAQIDALERAAQRQLAALAAVPLYFDALCVFEQAGADADFLLTRRCALP